MNIIRTFLVLIMIHIIALLNHSKTRTISKFSSTPRRVSSASSEKHCPPNPVFGRCELDSHADTTVAGANCVILNYTGKECNVAPYRDDYDSIKNVPIVSAATAWQSSITGQTYILILNEALWMGDQMDHSLINPNQLRHYGVRVQDDLTSERALSIITADNQFCMELQMKGTIIYTETHSPSDRELEECPHITLSSSHPWDPHNVRFPNPRRTLDEEMGEIRNLSTVHIMNFQEEEIGCLFSLD